MTKIDLAYGNPSFLFDYWRGEDLPETFFYYPYPYMQEKQNEFLEEAIRKIHREVKNVENVDDYQIVIGNGATQLLSALIYETYGTSVTAPVPYFLRFPVLAKIADTPWREKVETYPLRSDKVILSAPNNPTGSFDLYENQEKLIDVVEIIDACYNWPQYCEVKSLNDDIIVFSLSKATGHAGARLGWALIKDKALAENVKRSIEMTTMGVSQMAQEVGRFILSRETKRFVSNDGVFAYGKKDLDQRWETIRSLQLPFKVLNNGGMFLWCGGKIPEHVEGLMGHVFGDSPNKFRLNIGCSIYDFNQFIEPYKKIEPGYRND